MQRNRPFPSARLFVASLFTCGALSLPAVPAWACGGFFCFTQPVDQSAERILYVQTGPGKLSVHIQISYTGDDKQFSWVLPLQKLPKLGIGSDTVFQLLEQYTSPAFQLDWQNKADCWGGGQCLEDAVAGSGGGGNFDGVTVLAQETVGPYDTVVIQGQTAAAVIDWLNKNGYQQPKSTEPLLKVYVDQKYVFLALKLTKDKGTGDLAPIVVTLDEVAPCLPIRLTSIAAAPDMPIVAWVLGAARAIPKNFLHVELNDAVFDWMTGGGNYKTVVSKAVDQGSGHAWLTEQAAPTAKAAIPFAQPGWNTAELAKQGSAGKFLQYMMQHQYPRSSQMQSLIRKHVPKPKAFGKATDQEFYNCLQCDDCTQTPCADYKTAVAAQPFDAAKFAAEVDQLIIKPLQEVDAAWKAAKWMTRLYTTLSPAEMDKDPIFAFNPDLPEVERVRKAKAEPICAPGVKQAHEVKLTFANGQTLTVPVPKDQGLCWGFGPGQVGFGKGAGPLNDAGGQPARKVQVMDESGAPLDIHPDDADKVDAELNNAQVGKPSLSAAFKQGLKAASGWNPTKVGGTAGGADAGAGTADAGSAPAATDATDAGSAPAATDATDAGSAPAATDATDAVGAAPKPAAAGGTAKSSGGLCSAARSTPGSAAWLAWALAAVAVVAVRARRDRARRDRAGA
ncbi:MAG: DUF2330 domain-containing protein [Myxococcales bacterium]|nr:DUF2330 domain-containing protein [Myxococcales bacterium]